MQPDSPVDLMEPDHPRFRSDMKPIIPTLIMTALAAGCAAPPSNDAQLAGASRYGPNSGYFALDPEVAEANRQNTNRVEQEARDMNHQDRIRRAEATEVATRNNPTHVSTSNTFFWW